MANGKSQMADGACWPEARKVPECTIQMANGKVQIANVEHVAAPATALRNPAQLAERLLNYGVRVVHVVESLPRTLAARRIGDQLLRSAVSVGAHYEEAQGAESREDFAHKLQVGLKELRESNYWLRLLAKSNIVA